MGVGGGGGGGVGIGIGGRRVGFHPILLKEKILR